MNEREIMIVIIPTNSTPLLYCLWLSFSTNRNW